MRVVVAAAVLGLTGADDKVVAGVDTGTDVGAGAGVGTGAVAKASWEFESVADVSAPKPSLGLLLRGDNFLDFSTWNMSVSPLCFATYR